MPKLAAITGAFLAFGRVVLAATCGSAGYDPEQYVCWQNEFLCPITAGEGLSYCAGACYSNFMYSCNNNNILTVLPPVTTPFQLVVSNPAVPAIHGKGITASGLRWWIGGSTNSYCPDVVGAACPVGNTTAMVVYEGRVAMNVMVPGGQQAYLSPTSYMGYTQAHSAYVPPGSLTTGFAAYEGGGFLSLNGNGFPFVACPPTGLGGDSSTGPRLWSLAARNATNGGDLQICTPVNLRVSPLPLNSVGAWQYT